MAHVKQAESRQRLIDSTVVLMRRQGYTGTGVNEIARAGAAPMGSFYYHFPGGKEELAATAMGVGAEAYARVIAAALSSKGDFPTRVSRIATATADRLAGDDFAQGCPVATTALETVTTSEALQQRSRESFDRWIGLIRDAAFDTGIESGEAEELAMAVISVIEGAELLARVQRSVRPLQVAARTVHAICVAVMPMS